MGRKVVCKLCKNKGDSDIFHKVSDEKGTSKYYCNQTEYDNWNNENIKRQKLLDFVIFDVFGYEEGQSVNSILFKKLQKLNEFYDNDVILECFVVNKDTIHYWMNNKQFTNEYNMICYIMKIVEGNINDTYNKWKFKQQQAIKQENNSVDLDIMNQLDNNNNSKQDNNGILGFLDEEDM